MVTKFTDGQEIYTSGYEVFIIQVMLFYRIKHQLPVLIFYLIRWNAIFHKKLYQNCIGDWCDNFLLDSFCCSSCVVSGVSWGDPCQENLKFYGTFYITVYESFYLLYPSNYLFLPPVILLVLDRNVHGRSVSCPPVFSSLPATLTSVSMVKPKPSSFQFPSSTIPSGRQEPFDSKCDFISATCGKRVYWENVPGGGSSIMLYANGQTDGSEESGSSEASSPTLIISLPQLAISYCLTVHSQLHLLQLPLLFVF